jgi:hypothetical protein
MADATNNNEPHYIVNELLRFALAQSEEFQKLKAEQQARPSLISEAVRVLPVASSAARNPCHASNQ